MRRLSAKHDQVLEDLRSMLEDGLEVTGAPWPDVIEYAMNETWDALKKSEPAS